MAFIHRLIFRVDFDQHYAFADQPGKIIQTILDSSDGYWELVGPTNNVFQINAVNGNDDEKQKRRARSNFTVDTFAISGSVEVPRGISFEQVLEEKYLSVCGFALDQITNAFGVRNFNRVGARFFVTGGETANFNNHRQGVARRYAELSIPQDLIKGIELSDFAQILVGSLEHDIKFRLQSGPGNDADLKQFLGREILQNEIDRPPHEFTADIDIYQENINFNGTTLTKWIKAKQPYLNKLLEIAKYSARSEHKHDG